MRNGRPRAGGHSGGIIDRAMPIGPRSTRALPAVDTTGALRQAGLLAGAMLVAGIVSAFVLKQDVNWDLQNYHFYNAWAFVHQRLGWDIAPAQLQTYHNPLLDLPYYAMVAADWPPRLTINCAASMAAARASRPTCSRALSNSAGSNAPTLEPRRRPSASRRSRKADRAGTSRWTGSQPRRRFIATHADQTYPDSA